MENCDIFRAEIFDCNESGIGIGRLDGLVVFVPGLLEGDLADIRIVSREKNYAVGEVVEMLRESPRRAKPVCSSCAACGGCTLCHVSFEYENQIKRNTVCGAFRRVGLPFDCVSDTLHGENRIRYRNKLTVHFDPSLEGFGLYQAESNQAFPFNSCAICPDAMNAVVQWWNEAAHAIVDSRPGELVLQSNSAGKMFVTLYTEHSVKNYDELSVRLQEAIPAVCGVRFLTRQKVSPPDSMTIQDEIHGLSMEFSPDAFRQVNREGAELLLNMVHHFASETSFRCAADLYCGSGMFGLYLAKSFPEAEFWGVEINEHAITDATRNAERNGISNIAFFAGDAAAFRKKIPEQAKPSFLVVDPPRAGLSAKMRRELIDLSPKAIAYVSCNPQTLARDLKELCAGGYKIKEAVPVNMFPMTKHVECAVHLTKI